MQLDKVVAYHKALSDPTRIRILVLLAGGELNGLALADKLSLKPATITHHAAKLREAGLIHERRDRNAIYFRLNEYLIRSGAEGTIRLIYRSTELQEEGRTVMGEKEEKLKKSVLNNFFDKKGRLKKIPSQFKKKLIILEHLAQRLEPGRSYKEKEINEFIQTVHDDFATIRREFIMHQYMFREKEIYELNPQEMWPKWAALS